MTTLSLAVIPAPAAVAGIHLTIENGVPDNVRTTITRGVTEAELFYRNNFGITLKDVEVVVSRDRPSFAKALQRLGCDKTEDQAKKHAAKAGGSSCPRGVAMPSSNNLRFMLGVLIHELSHKYQFQEGPSDRAGNIWWLVEGGATATAVYIMEKMGIQSKSDIYKEYLGELKRNRHPPLIDLRTIQGHDRARGEYPGGVYNMETLAALELARHKGPTSLYQYFLNLKKDKDTGKVFEMTFGIKLDRFEQEFGRWLTLQLSQNR